MSRVAHPAQQRRKGEGYADSSFRTACSASLVAKLFHELFEILRLAEVAINRGEADVGDLVELRELFHCHFTYDFGRDFRLAQCFETSLDAVDDALDPVVVDGPLAQGDA